MQNNAWQLELFGELLPVNLKKISSKTALKTVIDTINQETTPILGESPKAQATYPKYFHGLDVDNPTNIFEALLADRIKAAYFKTPVADIQSEAAEEVEEISTESNEVEEGGGMIGAHKKLLKLSLEDLRANRDVGDISAWIMDGNDQARLFSFDACCRVSEIDPDSLRSNLIDGGYILQHYLY